MARHKTIKPKIDPGRCYCGNPAVYFTEPNTGNHIKEPLCRDCGEQIVRLGSEMRKPGCGGSYAYQILRPGACIERQYVAESDLKIRRRPHRRNK